jgi:hypothetical protein
VLDTKLHTWKHQSLAKRTVLEQYSRVMNALKKSYTGTDAVLDALSAVINRFEVDERTRQVSAGLVTESSSKSPRPAGVETRITRIDDWGALVVCKPTFYLRLVVTFDLFMCNGKLPHEVELPPLLRLRQLGTEGSDDTNLNPTDMAFPSRMETVRYVEGQQAYHSEKDDRYVHSSYQTRL